MAKHIDKMAKHIDDDNLMITKATCFSSIFFKKFKEDAVLFFL